MATLDVLNKDKQKVGTIELRDDVFAADINVPLVHQVIKAQLAGRRQGTAKTKTKGEVRGGGRKPFRQKGTGNARQGSIRSPLKPGGGQTFGPRPRSYDQDTPKEMVRGAMRSALSDRTKANRVVIMDNLHVEKPKTKDINEVLKGKFQFDNVLVVDEKNRNLELSARNIAGVSVIHPDSLSVYEIIRHNWLVLTKRAAQLVESRFAPDTVTGS